MSINKIAKYNSDGPSSSPSYINIFTERQKKKRNQQREQDSLEFSQQEQEENVFYGSRNYKTHPNNTELVKITIANSTESVIAYVEEVSQGSVTLSTDNALIFLNTDFFQYAQNETINIIISKIELNEIELKLEELLEEINTNTEVQKIISSFKNSTLEDVIKMMYEITPSSISNFFAELEKDESTNITSWLNNTIDSLSSVKNNFTNLAESYKNLYEIYRVENGIPPESKYKIEIDDNRSITIENISHESFSKVFSLDINNTGKIKIIAELLPNNSIINIDVYIDEIIYDINLKEEINKIFLEWISLLKISGRIHFASLL